MRDYYQNTGNRNWVEPPETIEIADDLPAINTVVACSIQAYNTTSVLINVSKDKKRKIWALFCMRFDQGNSRWTFKRNGENYIEKIMRTKHK